MCGTASRCTSCVFEEGAARVAVGRGGFVLFIVACRSVAETGQRGAKSFHVFFAVETTVSSMLPFQGAKMAQLVVWIQVQIQKTWAWFEKHFVSKCFSWLQSQTVKKPVISLFHVELRLSRAAPGEDGKKGLWFAILSVGRCWV